MDKNVYISFGFALYLYKCNLFLVFLKLHLLVSKLFTSCYS